MSIRGWLDGRTSLTLADIERMWWRKIVFGYAVYWATVAAATAATYYRLYRAREIAAAKIEADLAEARLQALRQRLQPHFLFNALNGIAEMIREDPLRAEALVSELGTLLRTAMTVDWRDTIPLEEEVALSRGFLDLQGLRFGSRLSVRWAIDEETLRLPVPPQFLQPLVENAVRFAVAEPSEEATVTISARRDGDMAVITIEDSGPGPSGTPRPGGTGLAGSRALLASVFGDEFLLELQRAPTGGGLVMIRFPFAS